MKTVVQYVEGYALDGQGYLSPYFASQEKGAKKLEYEGGVYTVVIDEMVSSIRQILPFLEFAKKTQKPLIIVAQDFEAEPLTTMVVNKLQNGLKIVAIKAPVANGTAYLEDIAVFTGATLISTERLGYRVDRCDPVYVMGKCAKFQCDASSSIFVGGEAKPEAFANRIQSLKDELDHNILLGDYDKERIQERIAKFQGGIAIIKAGGTTDLIMSECRDRIEDAVCAVRAASEEGVVSGGGSALLHASISEDYESFIASLKSDEQRQGALLVRKACQQPMRKIYDNMNIRDGRFQDGGGLVETIKGTGNANSGFDASKNQVSLDLIKEAGIVDPVKVVKSALRYGAGLASILLTAECAVVEERYDFVKRVHEQLRL